MFSAVLPVYSNKTVARVDEAAGDLLDLCRELPQQFIDLSFPLYLLGGSSTENGWGGAVARSNKMAAPDIAGQRSRDSVHRRPIHQAKSTATHTLRQENQSIS